MPFTIPEAADLLELDPGYLSSYCSQRNIGKKRGRDRWLSDEDLLRVKNRPKRGQRGKSKKSLQNSATKA